VLFVLKVILKDYLRELPDALCTSSLYQMLMDALSVQVPGDDDGNAQLMLSIVDCLPRINQVRILPCYSTLSNKLREYTVNAFTTFLHVDTVYL
jgi:RhoGAP domain